MGRSPCCDEHGVKKGPWDPEEDQKLMDYIQSHGHGSWRALPKLAGLKRCGKSCRLRWTNYLRPDIKRGKFSDEEEQIIVRLHSVLGNKWSAIAARLPGRTDNEIKNFWNTHMRKKLLQMGIDPVTHRPRGDLNLLRSLSHLLSSPNMSNSISHWEDTLRIQEDAKHLAKIQLLQTMLHAVTYNVPPRMEMPPFHNYQFNEMHLGPQCNRLPDGPMACTHDPIAIPCNFSNPASMQHSDYEALMKSCSPEGQETVALFDEPSSKLHISGNTYDSINVPGSYAVKPANPAPHLGSDAHELAVLDSKHDQINPTEKSSHSSTSFDPWGELTLDDQSSDYCWADIIKSSPPWEMKA